jgi:NADPH:quinone reductase-like Zn-dependent oxidoreductase
MPGHQPAVFEPAHRVREHLVGDTADQPGQLAVPSWLAGEVARPVPLPTEVLVRMRAVGVNPVEAVIRSGQFPLLGQPPFVLGWDVAGVVEEAEPGVTRFQPGDEVYGMRSSRVRPAYAEYVAAPSRQLARKPAGLSRAEAAGGV